jgi:hypothetical protein
MKLISKKSVGLDCSGGVPMVIVLEIATVVVVAIAMALALAHVLELPGKLRLSAP